MSIRVVLAGLVLAASVLAQTGLEEKLADDGSRRQLFAPVADVVRPSVVEILDDQDRTVALGLVVASDLVVTKASELPNIPLVATDDGRFIEGRLVGLDEDYDVAVLAVEAKGLIPVMLEARDLEPGRWVVSPGSASAVWSGVVSVKALSIHRTSAFLGVMLENADDGGARVSQVVADSAAEAAGLQADDVILKFGGEAVADREELIKRIKTFEPGQEAKVEVMRADGRIELTVKLGRRSGSPRSRDGLRRRRYRPRGTVFSRKSSGFRRAFQHDTLLDANDCGGPVVDLRGRVVGLNIARASRTETLAVPAADLLDLVKTVRAERTKKTSLAPAGESDAKAPGEPRKEPSKRTRKRL